VIKKRATNVVRKERKPNVRILNGRVTILTIGLSMVAATVRRTPPIMKDVKPPETWSPGKNKETKKIERELIAISLTIAFINLYYKNFRANSTIQVCRLNPH